MNIALKITAKIIFGVVGFGILGSMTTPWWGWMIWLYCLLML